MTDDDEARSDDGATCQPLHQSTCLPGNDLEGGGVAAADAPACCEQCAADAACMAYTFNANDDPATNACWLKAAYDNSSAVEDIACTSGTMSGRQPVATGCNGTSSDAPCTCSYVYDGTPPADRCSAHLYNLATDPQERSECSLEYPDVVAELRQRLQKYVDAATKPINMYSYERAVDPASDPGLGDGAWGPRGCRIRRLKYPSRCDIEHQRGL